MTFTQSSPEGAEPQIPDAETPSQHLQAQAVSFRGADSGHLAIAHRLREEIFVTGQGVSIDDDHDGMDADAEHVLLYRDGEPVGVARMREIDADTVKVERVGILGKHRGEGLGAKLMRSVERVIAAADPLGRNIELHAQVSLVNWYRDLGYSAWGYEFEEVGMAHQKMIKRHYLVDK